MGIQLAAGTYLAINISPDLLIRACIAIPLIIGVSRYTGSKVANYSNQVQTNLADSSKIANETLGAGFKTVHTFNKQNYEMGRYKKATSTIFKSAMDMAKWRSTMFGFNTVSGNLALFYMLYSATGLVITGDITVGALTSFALYTTWMGIATASLLKSLSEVKRIQGAGSRLFEFIR